MMKKLYSLSALLMSMVFFLCMHAAYAAPMNGTYTIDKSGSGSRNFTSFKNAVAQLKDSGVNGKTTFNIADGSYYEQVVIPRIKGSSAANIITFQSASNDSTKVILYYAASASTSNNYVLCFNNAANITVRKMTIKRSTVSGAGFGDVVYFTNGTKNIRIENNFITGPKSKKDNFYETLIFFNDVNTTDKDTNIVIENNLLINGSYGIVKSYNKYSNTGYNLQILKNTLDSCYTNSISVSGIKALKCSNNSVKNLKDTNGTAMLFYSLKGTSYITCNKVTECTSKVGIYLRGGSNDSDIVTNNFISLSKGYSGMYVEPYSGHCRIYYNTVLITGKNSSSAAILIYLTSIRDFYKNNLFINRAGGYCINDYGNKYSYSTADYNDLYTNGNYIACYKSGATTTNFKDLVAWQKATGKDLNSVSVNPVFISNTDLHLRYSSLKNATPVWIKDDIDGNTRSASPCLGADEFIPLAHDIKVESIESPVINTCGDSFTKLTIRIANTGKNDETNIPVYVSWNGGTFLKAVYTDTLPAFATDTISFSALVSTYSGGYIPVTAYTDLSTDMERGNDSLVTKLNYYPAPNAPNAWDGFNCSTGKVKLAAKGTGSYTIRWHSSDSSNAHIIATGDTFVTPLLTRDSTFFASVLKDRLYTSSLSTSLASSGYNALSEGLVIDATDNTSLDSVSIYPEKSGTVYINLLDKSGAKTIAWDSVSFTIKSKGQVVRIGLYDRISKMKGFKLKKGLTYQLVYDPSSAPTPVNLLYHVGTGAFKYPYSVSYVAAIQKSTDASTPTYYYFFFYRLVFSVPGCTGGKTKVTAFVNANINGSSFTKGINFKGKLNAGTSANPDEICGGQIINYGITSPSGYTNTDYGRKWIVQKIYVGTTGGYPFPYSSLTDSAPNASRDFNIFITPRYTDSTYIITAVITHPDGSCPMSITRYIKINFSPKADFNTASYCNTQPTFFIDTSLATSATKYYWNFGDTGSSSNTSSLTNPTHIYPISGKYSVLLVLTNPGGCADTITKTVVVLTKKFASFLTNSPQCLGADINYYDSSSAGSTYKILWLFGDGDSSTSLSPNHKYIKAGAYSVSQIVTKPMGCVDTAIQVVVINEIPSSKFIYKPVVSTKHFFRFSPLDSFAKGISYKWIFNSFYTDTNKNVIYHSNNSFKTILQVTNKAGCVSADTQHITINITGIQDIPEEYDLSIQPNPFTNTVKINYTLPVLSAAEFSLYDVLGNEVYRKQKKMQPAGEYSVTLKEESLPEKPGVYILQLRINDSIMKRRIVKF